jgi:energy-coupling factor transporter ATP-binding protein EcfA2
MRIQSIFITCLEPFHSQEIIFPELKAANKQAEVHIFVGENGTGKTRLLTLLAAACGDNTELKIRGQHASPGFVAAELEQSFAIWHVGGISKSSSTPILSNLPTNPNFHTHRTPSLGQNFSIFEEVKNRVTCLAFRGALRISDTKINGLSPVKISSDYDLQFEKDPKNDENFGQVLANLKIRAGMFLASKPTSNDDRNVRITRRLEDAVTEITGQDFYFVVQDSPELHLVASWGGNRMRMSQLPDGLRSIIGWLVGCIALIESKHPKDNNPLDLPSIILIDEPESHLHPAWQRKVLPAIQRLLPNSQLFVATHSPFVISSVNEGYYYLLKADMDGKVTCSKATACSRGDTYIDVVSDILGVPEWYDPETEKLLNDFRVIRDEAKKSGDKSKKAEMLSLALTIADRSDSLKDVIARELSQFDRQMSLSKE